MPKKEKEPKEKEPKEKKSKGLHNPFSRKSVHGKAKKDEAPVAIETIQRAHLGAPVVEKHRQHSSRFRPQQRPQLERLPNIDDQRNQADKISTLVAKLRQCCVTFDFEDPLSDLKSKEIKRASLVNILQYMSNPKNEIPDSIYEDFFKMFSSNAFRTLGPPSVNHGAEYDPEEDEPALEPAFEHLEHVYEIFVRFIESTEFQANVAKQYINESFIVQLLELFNSEDPRERDYLKSCLHRVYGRFLSLRSFVRKSIRDLFLRFVYEKPGTHNGIAELLEILGSIINGFTRPLKEEHKSFLINVLLPLHKVKSLSIHQPQLAYCIIQYLEKDPLLTRPVVDGLLRIWPRVNSPKEVMFLNELDEIVDKCPPEVFSQIKMPVFRQAVRCISSPHFQVAERGLYFLNSERLSQAMHAEPDIIMPLVFPVLYKFSKSHWNRMIHTLIFNTMRQLMTTAPKVFETYSQRCKDMLGESSQKQQERADRWKAIEQLAARSPLSAAFNIQSSSNRAPVTAAAALDDNNDVFSELKDEKKIKEIEAKKLSNNKMRRKSFLPQDAHVQEAIQAYSGHHIKTQMESE